MTENQWLRIPGRPFFQPMEDDGEGESLVVEGPARVVWRCLTPPLEQTPSLPFFHRMEDDGEQIQVAEDATRVRWGNVSWRWVAQGSW